MESWQQFFVLPYRPSFMVLAITEGLFTEPAAAAPVALLKKLIGQGLIDKTDLIVCVITGPGLKDLTSAMRKCDRPIKPNSWIEFHDLFKTILTPTE